MSIRLHSPFLGVPLSSSRNKRSNVDFSEPERRQNRRANWKCKCAKPNPWVSRAIWFSHFYRKNVELLKKNLGSRSGSIVNCVREPFSRSKALVKSLTPPLWHEGLILFRCSIFVAVISGVCLLVWYGKSKAKGFVEAKLLPSVCSTLSDYIQRELDFGKVRRISPLSITLESCSFGPHLEEFSCGEVPTIKLRIRPFSSLRRGKIVIDAVLSDPCLLVAQKKDFTWLGIPSSEGSLQRRSSSEEGIDYRTRTRRIAWEEAAARWARERDDAARQASEIGYVVSDKGSGPSKESAKEMEINFTKSMSSESFPCMEEKMHWSDHHCMDTSVDYDMRHADLEKSFGVKVPDSGLNFWSTLIKRVRKHKRKSNGGSYSEDVLAAKNRILKRSATAAASYFQRLSQRTSDETSQSLAGYNFMDVKSSLQKSQAGIVDVSATSVKGQLTDDTHIGECLKTSELDHLTKNKDENRPNRSLNFVYDPFFMIFGRWNGVEKLRHSSSSVKVAERVDAKYDNTSVNIVNQHADHNIEYAKGDTTYQDSALGKADRLVAMQQPLHSWHLNLNFPSSYGKMADRFFNSFAVALGKLKSTVAPKVEDVVAELVDGAEVAQTEGISKMLPVTLDSVYFKGGTLMLLAYGDMEPREMDNTDGHVKFQKNYGLIHVQLNGNCQMWRSDSMSEDGGSLSANVFVDILEQKWHANLKIAHLFAPLFERILEIPITWAKGRATGEVHMCMSRGETFPNIYGQLDVMGLAFQLYDAPSWFSDVSASLSLRGQRIFLHNTSGWFGSVPLEASGDFGINPDEGEFHVMCQVPCVEVNALMKTFKMRPLLFPVAGSVTAVFNCQGPLDAPVFVGSGIVSRKMANSVLDYPASIAYEAMLKNKEAGAVAAFDRVPFSYVSANFTFNTDNCVADLYGIRASLVDGGEIRGAGNAWICPEGELDDSAIDVNFSGNLTFDKILQRYMPAYLHSVPLKLGDLSGETKLSGSLLRPRFDIKWTAPKAEGSFSDARGDIIISHEYITVNSSSVAFELYSKVQTSYRDEYWLEKRDVNPMNSVPFIVEGVDLDLRMRAFEFFSFASSYFFDSPRPVHLKATGRIKFQGKVTKPLGHANGHMNTDDSLQSVHVNVEESSKNLVGDVAISGLKLNQLMLAPQLAGLLKISREYIKLDATGRPDESLALEVVGPLQPSEENLQNGKMCSFSLQKGQLRANACFRPLHTANLELRHLPLDELELASLRGVIQRAEIQLNLQKRRGHGALSVLQPKFSGVLGEALDVAARWSGDVITVEKTILEQSNSRYELQGEYVLPGSRERSPTGKETGGLLKRAMTGHLSSVISSMGRWRMRLEVPRAEVVEMLPLARLLSRSTDPAFHSRSKDFFIRSLQSVGLCTESVQELLEVIRGHYSPANEVILEDLALPGLAELKGRWHGSLDASGGGNGDTMADFDFHGEDWEWGTYKTQRVLAVGAYSNDDGLRLDNFFIQKDNATIHADGTLLGQKNNLHFAVLNFPVSLVPTVIRVVDSLATDVIDSLHQLLAPIKGILHMEGDLRGSPGKPECDVQVRLLDGAIEGIDLGRAEIVASLTSSSRFLFNAKFEPAIQNGHVHIQGSVPVTFVQNNLLEEQNIDRDKTEASWVSGWTKESGRASLDDTGEKKASRGRSEDGWDTQLAESLRGLNWNILDVGEVRIDADIKDGGMMLLTALSPHANWLHGNADVVLQVRGTVEQPLLDGSASFHRASVSSPVLRKPLTNLGGTLHVKSNRLCIGVLESKVSRRGKLFIKGNLPFKTSEASLGDQIDLKCEILEVRAKNILSGQVDTQMQITGSILQPNISGKIKLSHGEAYLPHDRGSGAAPFDRLASKQSRLSVAGVNRAFASRYVSRFFNAEPAALRIGFSPRSVKSAEVKKEADRVNIAPKVDVHLSDLKLELGPELRILYPLILNFAVSGELELNGLAHPKLIKPKGILTFENGDVNLVATQVRLKKEHLNIAKFEPEHGLDPMLDLALVGSEWQFRILSRASNWQDNLIVTTRSVEQDGLSPTEAARVFESQLAESILEGDGQLAFKKLATATLETLMPRIEGKGAFGQARWRMVYAPQIPSLLSLDPTVDPFKSLAHNLASGAEVEVQLGRHLQASVARQLKDPEKAMQWTLIYQLTSRLRVLLQSAPTQCLLFEYSATSQD